MNNLARLLGKTWTPITELFSTDASGWNDLVRLKHYPSLSAMQEYLFEKTGINADDLHHAKFEFPQSLDDFGLKKFFRVKFAEKYDDYVAQWVDSDDEVVRQQICIQTDCQRAFPQKSQHSLYLLVGKAKGEDRVMYVGKAKNGMLLRFFNGPKIAAQNNNYIGDCRSYESRKKPNYTWRAKSAELRRRGVYKVFWTTIPPLDLDHVESSLIRRKRELISEATGIRGVKDPVNSRE